MEKILNACVDEMYHIEKGSLIERPDEIVFECGDGYITRKQIKHIVEQRKSDDQPLEEIKKLINYIPDVITQFDFEASNPNQKYSHSILRVKVFKRWEKGVVVVMDAPAKGRSAIITAYPYRTVFAYFLLLEKLNASAAGKTPSP